jgi:carboxyl-terminal processing protease
MIKRKSQILQIFTFNLILLSIIFSYSLSANTENKSRFEHLELFNKVLNLIEGQYYREVDTEKLIQGAIKGMMSTLDPHSAFLDKDLFEKMNEDTKGEFGGLGIEVQQKDGLIVIIRVIEETPAARAKIKPGDKIVEINLESALGLTLDESVEKMRGSAKSKIKLGIIRSGVDGIKQYDLVREVIKVKPVKAKVIDNSIIYIRLITFQKRSAESIVEEIKEFRKKNKDLTGIILDLRSNPGGLLDEAVDVASIFLRDGVVVSTEERDPKNKKIHYVKKNIHKEFDAPLAVLINGSSASASEIVAGALQDHKRGIIMGSRSFGKGSVQTVARVDDSNGIKMTTAQYMTPSNKKIQAIGIIPDILIADYDSTGLDKAKLLDQYVREVDLKNHLSATKETEEEKNLRLEIEKEDRKVRVERLRMAKKQKEKVEQEEEVTEVEEEGSEDFPVKQAANYLKSFKVLKAIVQ